MDLCRGPSISLSLLFLATWNMNIGLGVPWLPYNCKSALRMWEFPGDPVVRTPWFHCRVPGFDPWLGNFVGVVWSLIHVWLSTTPGLQHANSSVLHHLPEFSLIHVHWVNDAVQPSHPLLCPSPFAFCLSQHQGKDLASCSLWSKTKKQKKKSEDRTSMMLQLPFPGLSS